MSVPALPAVVEAAVDWMVLLSSGEAAEADRVRFEAWLQADPRHAAAWEAVAGAVKTTFAPLGDGASIQAAGAALLAPVSRRRALRNALLLALAAGGLAALVDRQTPLRTLAADLRTGTGERHTYPLPDGSEVTLNARSAVDLAFDGRARVLRLRAGAVYVRVAADAARPFIVASPDGEVQALGTVFGVARDEQGSVACVIEHSVEVRAAGQRRVLAAERARASGRMASARRMPRWPKPRLGTTACWWCATSRWARWWRRCGPTGAASCAFHPRPRGCGCWAPFRWTIPIGYWNPCARPCRSRSAGWAAGWSASTCAPMPPKKMIACGGLAGHTS